MKAVLIGLWAALAVGAAQAQGPGGLKAGLWESRTLKMAMDGKDMLPQMKAAREQMQKSLAGMPPEQRKKMEAVMAAQGADPTVRRICVSAEMARKEHAFVPRPARADCAEPRLNRSGNRTAFEFSCKQGGGTITGKGETLAAGDEISTKVETASTDAGGAKHVMAAETQMKFISADCGGLKPLDQLVKEMQQAGAAGRQGAPKK
ncbi:MAG: DUF3617 domain-containing protein [Ottowia sp.]|uniref:DUF3617 domain-containing protein n=1 Tax=Ottowia sp. TaxID=1898956 RepID=UPI0039E6CBC7